MNSYLWRQDFNAKKPEKESPFAKTTQRTAISNDVPRQPPLFSCCFRATTKPNYEERLPWEKHTMPKHRCLYPEWEYETEDVKDKLVAVLLTVHSNGTHVQMTSQPATQATTAKIEKVRRATISSAGSSNEWSYFLTRWKDYAEATKLKGNDMVIQLLECCEEQLRKDLTKNAGGLLTNKSVDKVMAAIKKLAVREDNTIVTRVQLHNMCQDWDETTRSFSARLRDQASVCKFLIKCPGCDADINYTKNILRDIVTCWLANSKIQLDLLGEKNQDMSLEEVLFSVHWGRRSQ